MAPQNDQEKLCFVIGPIGESGTDIRQHADWVLSGIINQAGILRTFSSVQGGTI
jgi:hypothetical protein